ncbi:hypothetical protein A2833_02245 [Candidatus Azambacteria bacterium RIFCSPHIGHO2_01_FULL_44_55]|uniref:Methyltransferase domain-containing protein n=1 Tax=Candidatus Azambacteria bacterium RIFCSPLOWO2_02_FULL_44_14 TaxID=1797306 RepID=A0A1F5CCP5_9BACT|nr:MAG: hypothetical protein A3A18_01615 [Candidatus Azambacteria bacterium RIFCSPLOWO2_01_FULL_44_84]OGD32976.1 MAG: hypothetical protein A3C78_00400 [Candidatus Azambacteria bacterium RIFCSPHIGHO2_02_FULL_45_18]OGD40420.1 MAG: hypothetical protein A2833_02245 [Candidatus Azambacteria bacterium RIFCSPHIGHO2_01_FULL_44_55]OGD40632.1 MAG: hypothetical protein A3I30_01265 [Candidatus Azambacteria bacterium RIFCSPLOWO2_02_FULL_44_14]OGD52321.1 MAG: hypothetical protein A2608_00215 [Candidatus Azam
MRFLKEFFSRIAADIHALSAWEWGASSYGNIMVPSRPSEGDLKNYERVIDAAIDNSNRVVVLGTTPQIRNMLAGFNGEIMIADFSQKMYRVTESRVTSAVLAKENFIRANWLHLSSIVPRGSVDLVVGDLVFNNIHPEARDKFVNMIGSLLKPGGIFLTRVKLHNSRWHSADPIDIVKLCLRSMPAGSLYSPFMIYRLGDKILDGNNFSFRSRDFEPLLRAALAVAVDSTEHAHILRSIWNYKNIDMTRSFYPKSFFESLVEKQFKLENALIANDYEESEFFPIYQLQKK